MRTGLVYHPAYLEHDMGAGHPESPNRLRAIMQQLEQSGTAARLTRIEPRKAEDDTADQHSSKRLVFHVLSFESFVIARSSLESGIIPRVMGTVHVQASYEHGVGALASVKLSSRKFPIDSRRPRRAASQLPLALRK